jgi:hypothetical protein
VILIGAKVALAAISALEIMMSSILVASCCTDAANTSRPMPQKMIAPMHIAHGSPEVYSVLPWRGPSAVVDETSPDCDDFSVRHRIAVGFREISSASDNLSIANDDCAECIVALASFIQRQSHEAFIIKRGGGYGSERLRRQNRSGSHRDNHASSTVEVGRVIRTAMIVEAIHVGFLRSFLGIATPDVGRRNI